MTEHMAQQLTELVEQFSSSANSPGKPKEA
jgi:hypothetical protein